MQVPGFSIKNRNDLIIVQRVTELFFKELKAARARRLESLPVGLGTPSNHSNQLRSGGRLSRILFGNRIKHTHQSTINQVYINIFS